ncbi:MAG: hypothetical protein A2W90_21340 [Bacteroidetes bacterium GWF2_42_66]|nr:MAG: hypothetical protein A2W92_02455 [Bacteroidetes bacterium GWA2_42_15]OFX98878.1 MAG: hypothetical protein A2W89_12975 [Bacteroidetes bacterium GWE2_42_39]OFY45593.1 MAG: hypothetical protein A2W90_21340 [Bacteroidetes bacterium GWF2_42_66]HBL77427.1 hypothetical protein [Prolixibacteraceae bacterium]HCU62409.1 hypothetical protein [Prolixibacteraceae bacterium]
MSIYKKRLYGGALQFTIVFSLLGLMMLSLFLVFVRLNALEIFQGQRQTQLIENIRSAIVIMENNPKLFETPSHNFQITNNSSYETEVNIQPWGFYDAVKISSSHTQSRLSGIYLFSDNIRKSNMLPSLYLSDPKRYLSVGGKTYLGNNSYLPAYGVRKAYVGGIGYTRESFVNGNSYKANNELPELNRKWMERYFQVKNIIKGSENRINIDELRSDTLTNSFSSPSLVVACPDDYFLSRHYFEGNIIICGTKLTFDHTVRLKNCIVFADSIVMNEGFTGEGQFMAKNRIETGESSVIKVSSVLFMNNTKSSDQIVLGSSTQFQGEIIVANNTPGGKEALIIESGCQLIGQVYCNGYCTFDGIIFGSLYTRGFIKRDKKGLYENYLVNVCIDIERLPVEYNGISLIDNPLTKNCNEEVF